MRALPFACLIAVLSLSACATTQPPASPTTPAPELSTAFTLSSGAPRTPAQEAVRFDKADLAIRVDPDRKAIEAVAVLDFTAIRPTDRIQVELDTRFAIRSIVVNGRPLNTAQWRNPDGRLTIVLPETLPEGRGVSVRIAYAGQPRTAPNAPWDGGFVWSRTADGQPWIATAVQGEGCDLFWPCIDHPLAEPGRVDLHITVPTGLAAPSNGRFLGSVDHGDGWTTWNWTARQPNTYAIALNIGPYTLREQTYQSRFGNSFPMQFWHLTSDDPGAVDYLFAQFAPIMDFYEASIGPFPFGDEKMAAVETPHLGMEHQTINAYGNRFRLDGKGYDWLLYHELAHEWFGNQMTERNADDMWLHEGFGTYWQALYLRTIDGERGMQDELHDQRLKIISRFPIVSGGARETEAVYSGAEGPGIDIYVKGSLIAHSLRMLVGDRAFFSAVTQLVYGRPDPRPGNFAPRNADTLEFQALVERAAGRDLDWFFDAYLRTAALPRLDVSRSGDRLALSWTTGGGAVFPMPVEVEVDGRIQTVPMIGGQGVVTAAPDALVIIDPASKVLRQQAFVDEFRAVQAARAAAAN